MIATASSTLARGEPSLYPMISTAITWQRLRYSGSFPSRVDVGCAIHEGCTLQPSKKHAHIQWLKSHRISFSFVGRNFVPNPDFRMPDPKDTLKEKKEEKKEEEKEEKEENKDGAELPVLGASQSEEVQQQAGGNRDNAAEDSNEEALHEPLKQADPPSAVDFPELGSGP